MYYSVAYNYLKLNIIKLPKNYFLKKATIDAEWNFTTSLKTFQPDVTLLILK